MAANRLLDARLDALNPRTARRAIPSGALSRSFYAASSPRCASSASIAAAGGFYDSLPQPLAAGLSLPVLAFLCAYPLLKRFTRLCHYYLGAALALAPVCAWLAIRGSACSAAVLMAGAVLCWTAGIRHHLRLPGLRQRRRLRRLLRPRQTRHRPGLVGQPTDARRLRRDAPPARFLVTTPRHALFHKRRHGHPASPRRAEPCSSQRSVKSQPCVFHR